MQIIKVKKEDYLETVLDDIGQFIERCSDDLPVKQIKTHIRSKIDIAKESINNEYDQVIGSAESEG